MRLSLLTELHLEMQILNGIQFTCPRSWHVCTCPCYSSKLFTVIHFSNRFKYISIFNSVKLFLPKYPVSDCFICLEPQTQNVQCKKYCHFVTIERINIMAIIVWVSQPWPNMPGSLTKSAWFYWILDIIFHSCYAIL